MQMFGAEILGSQLILSTIIIFILIKTWISFGSKQISISFSILWTIFWYVILFFIYYPGLLIGLANKLSIGRGVDLAIYVSIICLFYLIYRLFVKIENLEKQITKIVRKVAINENK